MPTPGRRLVTNGLRFAGPAVEAWLDLLGRESQFTFAAPSDLASSLRAQRQFADLVSRRPCAYKWQARMLVTQVLGLLRRVRGVLSEPTRTLPAPVARVLDAVATDPARKWKARELAGVAGVSYSKLRALFGRFEGGTLKAFLQRIRLEQARLRLGDHRLTVKAVARELDFSSEHHFSHSVRAATGMSPSHLRLASQTRPA